MKPEIDIRRIGEKGRELFKRISEELKTDYRGKFVAITSSEIRVLKRIRRRGGSIRGMYFIWGGLATEQQFRSKEDEMIKGKIYSAGSPIIQTKIIGSRAEIVTDGILDTGFTGHLCLPITTACFTGS